VGNDVSPLVQGSLTLEANADWVRFGKTHAPEEGNVYLQV